MISHFVKIMDDLELFHQKTPKNPLIIRSFFGGDSWNKIQKMLILQYLGIIINIIFDSFILLSAHSWPYRFILGILFGSRLMAHGRLEPCGKKERRAWTREGVENNILNDSKALILIFEIFRNLVNLSCRFLNFRNAGFLKFWWLEMMN